MRDGVEYAIAAAEVEAQLLEVEQVPTTPSLPHRFSLYSFCKSQFPHKSVNISFSITDIKNKLTDLSGIDICKTEYAIAAAEVEAQILEVEQATCSTSRATRAQ